MNSISNYNKYPHEFLKGIFKAEIKPTWQKVTIDFYAKFYYSKTVF